MTPTSFPRFVFTCLAVFAIQDGTASAQQQLLELKKGDHIAVIGNTLADRMQHSGASGGDVALSVSGTQSGRPQSWIQR